MGIELPVVEYTMDIDNLCFTPEDLDELSPFMHKGKKPYIGVVGMCEGARVDHKAAAAIDGIHIIPPSASVKNSRIDATMTLYTNDELRFNPSMWMDKHIGGDNIVGGIAGGFKYTPGEIYINDISTEQPSPMWRMEKMVRFFKRCKLKSLYVNGKEYVVIFNKKMMLHSKTANVTVYKDGNRLGAKRTMEIMLKRNDI